MNTATAAERNARTNSNNANPLAQKSNKHANNKTTHCRAIPRAYLAIPLVFLHCTYVFVCRFECLATGNARQCGLHPTAPHASHLTPSHAPQARQLYGQVYSCALQCTPTYLSCFCCTSVACCYCCLAVMLVLHGVAEF